MKIEVHNKQRRYKIDLNKIEAMTNKLTIATFDNLRKNKPKAKWVAHLNNIENSAAISLIFVSPQAIKKLNKDWLHKDKETDVLSFPLQDLSSIEMGSEFSAFQKIELIELGELFISYEQAIKQAKEYNHSLDRELAFLFVHGFLHIFGFDHQNKQSKKEMFGRQREILNSSNYFR